MNISSFADLQQLLLAQLKESKTQLFNTNTTGNSLVETYLGSFDDPDVSQYHNCNCCKSFLRQFGGLVYIESGQIKSLWDFAVGTIYHKTVTDLNALVSQSEITKPFTIPDNLTNLGTPKNIKLDVDTQKTITYEHFFLPTSKIKQTNNDNAVNNHQVFRRGLEELTLDSAETVLELIDQNLLYRGEEHRHSVVNFIKHKKVYDILSGQQKSAYTWSNYHTSTPIRNTVIGSLLIDLSDTPDELTKAVTSFERKVAPTNYKRPTALITPKMIELAETKLKELGYLNSLRQRHATFDDIPVSEVIYLNRHAESNSTSLFDNMKKEYSQLPKLDKVESVTLSKFIKDIVPHSTEIEVLLENKHTGNMMNLLTQRDSDSPTLFNWDTPLSWTYNGNFADSVKERVKKQGGKVEGQLRISLDWFNTDDLDLHLKEPNGNTIFFNKKQSTYSCGYLDVDMNATSDKLSKDAVENIIFPNDNIQEGKYVVAVNNYTQRNFNNMNTGFNIEIECKKSRIFNSYSQNINPKNKDTRTIITFEYSNQKGVHNIKLDPSTNENKQLKEIYGIETNKFHKVTMITHSPNHYTSGNKHTFFILDKARNPETTRGFFNEYLKPELHENRKVFEVLGDKMSVPADESGQLAGLGFSSTQKHELICRIKGKFERIIKIELGN